MFVTLGRRRSMWGLVLVCGLLFAAAAHGQRLEVSNVRDVSIPDYATLRIGPFYSTAAFTQTIGYRYSRSSGRGTDYLFNNRRGEIKEDGVEFPMISRLDFRNYLVLTRHMDLDLSVGMSYEHYPMDTQDDEFYVDFVDEGVFGNLSTTFALTEYLRGTIYDNAVYRTDYVDTRGEIDDYGGSKYEYFRNTLGLNWQWEMGARHFLSGGLSRSDLVPRSDDFEDQEHTRYAESVAYSYELIDGVRVGARASFSQTYYDDPDREDAFIDSYSLFVDADRGAAIPLTDRTSLGASIGYARGYSGDSDEDEDDESDTESVIGGVYLDTLLREDLSHRLSWDRSLRGGFRSNVAIHDSFQYRINWHGELTHLGAFIRLSVVDPSSELENKYSTLAYGGTLDYPLTRFATLHASTTYTTRDNDDLDLAAISESLDEELGEELDDVVDEEDTDDYDTWVTTLSTGFNLTRKTTFHTSYTHIERISDSEDLEYDRDIFSALLRFRHQF